MRPVMIFVALAAVLLAALGVRLWQQEAALRGPAGGAGVIEGTAILVSSRVQARILDLKVEEGQEVKAGDVLLDLDCTDTQAALAEAAARYAVANAQAEAAWRNADATQHGGKASSEAARASAANAASLQAQRDEAARRAQRVSALGEDVTVQELDQAKTQAAGLDQELQGALASRAANNHQALAAEDQGRAATAQAQAADEGAKAAAATLERQKLLVGECTVKAPASGFVETLPWHVGELVAPGATLARLVDIAEVKATIYVPNAEVGKVKAGEPATVEADAYPGEAFSGKVSTITLTAEFTPRNIQTRSDRDRLVYPVEVKIPNADGKLRPGMPVQVTLAAATGS